MGFFSSKFLPDPKLMNGSVTYKKSKINQLVVKRVDPRHHAQCRYTVYTLFLSRTSPNLTHPKGVHWSQTCCFGIH